MNMRIWKVKFQGVPEEKVTITVASENIMGAIEKTEKWLQEISYLKNCAYIISIELVPILGQSATFL